MKDKIIVILGPTGVGKTRLSIELAKILDGEIINADSTQIYKDLDVATAKVTKEEMGQIPHHLLSIKDILENYTVYDYQKDCRSKIKEIKLRNKIPIIVGGTGLYIKAALFDYEFEEEQFSLNYDAIKTTELFDMLLKVDKNTNIHPNNRKRIIRALNYYNNTNKPLSDKKNANKLLYDAIFIGLTLDREKLYEIINKRVDIMVSNGLIDEAKRLYDSGIRSKAVMTPIGYKELFKYFDSEISLDEALDLIKQKSRKYAKRQYTWNNNKFNINWFNVDSNNFENTVKEVLTFINKG